MTLSPPAAASNTSRAIAGIVCVEAGMLLFAVQDGLMKSLLGDFTVWMLIVVRACVTVLVLVPAIVMLGEPHRLFSPFWPLHALRALLFAFGFAMFYTAFPFMGLAELTTIFFAAPLFTAVLAALVLGETIGPRRLACLLVGFAGVIIAMNPAGDSFNAVAIMPLICAFTYANSQIIARRIGERDSSLTMGLYTITLAGLFVLPMGYAVNQMFQLGEEFRHIRWDWQMPETGMLPVLLLMGAVGMGGYILLSRAYQIADASLVAPFDYSYLPIAAIMAYVVWGEVPGWHTVTGMVLIIASGLYLGYREIQQARRATVPAPTAEVAFVPGSATDALPLSADSISQRERALDDPDTGLRTRRVAAGRDD